MRIDRETLTGYGGSLLVHALVMVLLSLLVFDHLSENSPFSTEWMQEEGQGETAEFQQPISAELVTSVAKTDQREKPRPELPLSPVAPPVLESRLADALLRMITEDAIKADLVDGQGLLKMPDSARVVRKGSFAAWTVPEDPLPEKSYTIVIQIRLPEKTRRYRANDLSGQVVGSDKYRQTIPWDSRWPDITLTVRDGKLVPVRRRSFLPVHKGITQMLIRVPPAKKLVRDTIRIRSRMLKEEQTLEIVF